MVFNNESKGSNFTIEELLPSKNRTVFLAQKFSDIILKLVLVDTKRILDVHDDLAFVSGADAIGQGTVDLEATLITYRLWNTDSTHLVRLIALDEFDGDVVISSSELIVEGNGITNVGKRQIHGVVNLFQTGIAPRLAIRVVLLQSVS